jgi:hypothetical protein
MMKARGRACLEFDDHAVMGSGVRKLTQSAEHVVAHMRQDQLFRVDLRQVRFQRLQAEMVLDDLVVVIRLGNEQVRATRRRDQRIRPFGIGAVDDDAALGLDGDRPKMVRRIRREPPDTALP